jgi:hypothetical protein
VTEQEWFSDFDLDRLRQFIFYKTTFRKNLLMAIAWSRVTIGRRGTRRDRILEIADRYADRSASFIEFDTQCRGFFTKNLRPILGDQYQRHHPECVSILHDVVGNPFQPASLEPHWITENVVGLALAIYDERCFDRMPILADALMDAGCFDDEILNHCRSEGPHVRCCWVVDLLLGKE